MDILLQNRDIWQYVLSEYLDYDDLRNLSFVSKGFRVLLKPMLIQRRKEEASYFLSMATPLLSNIISVNILSKGRRVDMNKMCFNITMDDMGKRGCNIMYGTDRYNKIYVATRIDISFKNKDITGLPEILFLYEEFHRDPLLRIKIINRVDYFISPSKMLMDINPGLATLLKTGYVECSDCIVRLR